MAMGVYIWSNKVLYGHEWSMVMNGRVWSLVVVWSFVVMYAQVNLCLVMYGQVMHGPYGHV